MTDSIMLVCAVLASLATGVLVAYGVCLATFGLFRMRAKQKQVVAGPVTGVVDGLAKFSDG